MDSRLHWDDDLIDTVLDSLPTRIGGYTLDDVYAVIAAVEDWVLSAPIFDLYLSRKHAPDKAAIQRVREVCRDPSRRMMATSHMNVEWVDLNAVLNALEGDSEQ